MSTAVLLSIVAGLMSALPLMAIAAGPSAALLILLAPLPLFLAGLSNGVASVAIAGATTTAFVGFGLDLVAALGALLTLAAPVVVLVRQALLNRPQPGPEGGAAALEWYPPGLLITWLTGIGVALLLITLLFMGGGATGMEDHMRQGLRESLSAMAPQAGSETIAQMAATMAPIALGAGLVGWLFLLALNGVLAQGALTRFGRNLRPTPDIADIELPGWLTPALAIVLAAAFFASGDLAFIAKNLALILLLPFFFLGLAVVHVMARRTQARGFLIVTFYVVLVLFSWPAAVVVALGLLEQWLKLRRRFSTDQGGPEEQ